DDITAYGMLGSAYYLMGNEEKAFESWDKPFYSGKVNPLFYRIIGEYAIERRAFEKAIELYEKGKEVSNDKILYAYDLIQLYSITMQFEKAAQECCFILSTDPSQLQTVQLRILENINRPGALDATLKVIEDCADKNIISFSYLLARLYTEKKSFDKAYETHLYIDERQLSKGRDLYQFAQQMFAEKEYKLSSEVFKKITDRYPDSPIISQAELGYARSLEASLLGEYEKTLPLWKPYFPLKKFQSEETEKVLNAFSVVTNLYKHSEPAYESILRTANIKFYLLNDYEDARRLLNIIINEAPLSKNSGEAYLELGNIALIEGNLDESEKDYSAVLDLKNASTDEKNEAVYQLAKVNLYQVKFDEARKMISKVLTDLKDNSANDALELSLLLNPDMSDSSNLMIFAQAEFLVEQRRFDEAAIDYKKLVENQQAFILQAISEIRYSEMMIAVDNYPEAISVLEGISSEGGKNIYADKAVYLLGKIHQFGLKNYGKAQEFYQKLLADYPKSIYNDDAREQLLLLQNKPGT
ncbi:MAG: tetratricopeptide repeat protein, partial [Ignavibacteriaceae bacterium]|nr:tetratricopeptide repeat protein [Ignavibacteriaceae bacterium]